ncbi:aspartic proteinase from Irpex Lacteus [Suillus spraguei]|nr:aspartic proteinase from Irpex Lacteus [Suillus spraguei]
MLPAASLSTFLLLALSITGSPVEHDRARIAALRDSGARGHAGSTPVTSNGIGYIAVVDIGSPPRAYKLIVDTGSANTWVGASAKYVVTKTSVNTQQPVEVGYGSGGFVGTEYLDTVALGSGLTITKQSIGVASTSSSFGVGVDGILGLGLVDLTQGSLINLPATTIPTVTNNLHSQGTIPQEVFSVFFEPSSSKAETKGELTFGGTDATKYTGDIAYTPITTTKPASNYWGINESITYGSQTILSSTAGIVDTGTTFIYIATDGFVKYQSATGATLDEATGLLTVSSAKYNALKNLDFHIGTETFTLTANAQIWPRSLNSIIGGASDDIYLVVNDIKTTSGHGLDFIDGYAFLQRFYSVFDTTKKRVGFAKTSFTDATAI